MLVYVDKYWFWVLYWLCEFLVMCPHVKCMIVIVHNIQMCVLWVFFVWDTCPQKILKSYKSTDCIVYVFFKSYVFANTNRIKKRFWIFTKFQLRNNQFTSRIRLFSLLKWQCIISFLSDYFLWSLVSHTGNLYSKICICCKNYYNWVIFYHLV